MTEKEQLEFTAAYNTIPGTGWLSYAEAELLWKVVNTTTGPILEVGSYQGRSTCLLGATGRTVWAVDPFDNFSSDQSGEEIQRLLLRNLVSRNLHNVVVFPQAIETWAVPGPFQFAYLDGDHTYQGTLNQIDKALAGNPRIIAIHDVNDSGGGLEVKRAALERLGPWQERVERLAVWQLEEKATNG